MSDEVIEWIDPDGATTTVSTEWKVKGRFMPKPVFQEDEVSGQPGALLRSVRHDVREFVLAAQITAANAGALRTEMRSVVAKMDPTRGVGRIRVTSPLGDQREIRCVYADGLGMDEVLDESSGPTWQKAAIVFRAHDPYWYDVSPNSETFAVEPDQPAFFPIFPLKLTASELALDMVVDNAGDVESWPTWTIAGPGGVVKLSNLTTGKMIYFPSSNLVEGQSIIIDTRPTRKTVQYDDGSNAYSAMSTDSSLWSLERGSNAIRLEMSGVDASVSYLQLNYYRRYLSP